MATKNASYRDGFDDGYKCGIRDGYHNALTRVPEVQRNDYSLTPHDLDTIALGIALVVLHADSIQTITATMDTQQKLGIADKVLGTLHLIATNCGLYHPFVPLHEEMPNPWLNPCEPTSGAGIAENQEIDDAHDRQDTTGQMDAYDDIPF